MLLQSETMSCELLKKVMNKVFDLHAMQFLPTRRISRLFVLYGKSLRTKVFRKIS